ncbi:NADH-quinone oxidoreductase subunit L [Daejeonella sp.]|jgi:NADH-quinone oxidoreductase subunit L|uniref:NADH-quinone oxidoreductase subunit L n=1 Tax=Daejeonella sp. TaxID=2805397 RepID=UPI0037BF6D5C
MAGLEFSEFAALLSILLILLPFLSFILIIFGKKGGGENLALANISLAFILSLYLVSLIWNKAPVHYQLNWFLIGEVQFTAGILLNNLSLLMISLVSGISVLVHIYSRSYMKNDPNIHRYWAYLGLFCFSMFALSISDNLLLIYLFWELVGFSSFLLIGFWFTKHAASQAAKKAFLMNRIGDIGFLLGIMIVFSQFHTLDISILFGENGLINVSIIKDNLWVFGTQQIPEIWLTIAGIGFFIGAMAKSAQFPLHTWLPDAMEGPTSVSSLIHAATMVAAGVFLIARVYPIFDPFVLNMMVFIGAISAFMAATIALTQNDIKRILAYSTISQLGFMVMAMGIGAYSESIFHLTTHAFFKCLLFLAAGSIIHQLHHYRDKLGLDFDYQDIRMMGGLRKSMPLTFLAMCLASAALIGLPFTSAFLSKDAIIVSAFEWAENRSGISQTLPYLMVLTSWLTVFYISRLLFKVFFVKSNLLSLKQVQEIKDPSKKMTYVLVVLAFFCLFLVFSVNPFSSAHSWILNAFPSSNIQKNELFHWIIPIILTFGTIVLIALAYSLYVKRDNFNGFGKGIFYRFSKREWYLNELYSLAFIANVEKLSKTSYWFDQKVIDALVLKSASLVRLLSLISSWIDKNLIDGLVNATGSLAKLIGRLAKSTQSGKLQQYLTTMLLLLISFFILTYFL